MMNTIQVNAGDAQTTARLIEHACDPLGEAVVRAARRLGFRGVAYALRSEVPNYWSVIGRAPASDRTTSPVLGRVYVQILPTKTPERLTPAGASAPATEGFRHD